MNSVQMVEFDGNQKLWKKKNNNNINFFLTPQNL